jgi:translation initiation factor IF-3
LGIKRRKTSTRGGREERARVNEQIRAREVRVIGADGKQVGIMPVAEARDLADEAGLDLVEVAAEANPPVCRIMDYGKYRYEQRKKEQEARKRQTVIEVKEIKLRPKTERHDLDFKIRNIRKFIGGGNKVKVTLRFRGREIVYADSIGVEVLRRLAGEVADVAVVLQEPAMAGRQMTMVLGPRP